MSAILKTEVSDALRNLDDASTWLLSPEQERQLLGELVECRRTLAEALVQDPGQIVPEETDGHRALSRFIAEAYAHHSPVQDANEAVFERYFELRTELALGNLRLVAYIAKRYRNRGIAYSDLIQEGFCGLLEAIDRFDLTRQTKLSTYATWWIRQAIQSAVAAGAYPVRLTPRHLRQLAQNQNEHVRELATVSGSHAVSSESIQRIHAATRPAVAIDESRDGETHFTLRYALRSPERDLGDDKDLDESVAKWMESLRPRERLVLSYRFGLGGSPRLSLSQVGKVLGVSKERVRQIQAVALKMLRTNVSRGNLIQSN